MPFSLEDGMFVPREVSMRSSRLSIGAATAATLAGLVVVAACGGAPGGASPSGIDASSTPPPVVATASPPPTDQPSTTPGSFEPVRLALDWTPNTNHTGFFVADASGWYADAGIDLQVLPYANTTPETLMAADQADCGISFQDSLTFAVAAGLPLRSVMAILQHTASAIAVLASSPIARPRDLDGRVYAGFGYPNEVPTLDAVIRADGGTGTFDVVTLDATAYEALYSGAADFTIPFTAWEGVEATERGIDLRYFRFEDYGFPDFYQVVLACSEGWLAAHPAAARAFVGATVRGFEVAADHPEDAAAILISANPGVFDANPALALDSARFLATGGYYVDAGGWIGRQTLEEWTAYSSFLFAEGLLTGPEGQTLVAPPDYADLFTNEFLP